MNTLKTIGINYPKLLSRCNACISSNIATNLRSFSVTQTTFDKHECQVLIVGGGSGGCAMAAKFAAKLGPGKVIVVDPADRHYYQPMFTLIGGGMKRLENSYRPMQSVLPKKAKWIKEKAVHFDPDHNTVTTSSGTDIKYDMLLVATGLQLHYEKIPGLVEALSIPNGNVCSIYSPQYVDRTYDCLKKIKRGNALFTFPSSPVKCPGAPQKIVYIAEHYFRKFNKRKDINICYNTSLPVIFGVQHYAKALCKIVEKRDIGVNYRRNLVRVDAAKNIAVFQDLNNPSDCYEEEYSMLHAVPPMSTPDELAKCEQLVNETGFVDVDKLTMQHCRYNNVFAIGDCSASPNSKTAASAAAQSPVVFKNMLSVMEGKPLTACYDGYASCPLVTGYHTCILAEFDYTLTPLETFPMAQDKERYTMFYMKKDLMPLLYWHIMLNGYWNGPEPMRKMFSIFKFGKKR